MEENEVPLIQRLGRDRPSGRICSPKVARELLPLCLIVLCAFGLGGMWSGHIDGDTLDLCAGAVVTACMSVVCVRLVQALRPPTGK